MKSNRFQPLWGNFKTNWFFSSNFESIKIHKFNFTIWNFLLCSFWLSWCRSCESHNKNVCIKWKWNDPTFNRSWVNDLAFQIDNKIKFSLLGARICLILIEPLDVVSAHLKASEDLKIKRERSIDWNIPAASGRPPLSTSPSPFSSTGAGAGANSSSAR